MEEVNELENSLQIRFLRALKDLVPANRSFVDELAGLMAISPDSVYRRLRGETALTLEEVSMLCSHFRISFDMFSVYDTGNVTFNYSLLNDRGGFRNYLQSIYADMITISRAKPGKISYTAIDVPIFHHFNYPELSAFKMFYWLKGVVNDPVLQDKKFDVSLVDPEMAELGKKIYKIYCEIPSIEIWTNETINSLLRQIEYFWDSGIFARKSDALTVCSQVLEEVSVLQKQAESGFKDLGLNHQPNSAFMLYQSEIEIGNNCILIEKSGAKSVYLSIHTFNKILTQNRKFCEETESWITNIIHKSMPLSSVSEKVRYKFFKKMNEKIEALILKIESE